MSPALPDLAVLPVVDPEALAEAMAVRRAVFVAEQGIPEPVEFDVHDRIGAPCRHLLARQGGVPVGTLRWRLVDGAAKIERVAVLREARGQGVGLALLKAALEAIEAAGIAQTRLHAQPYATGFYARLGFVAEGQEFLEDGIPHIAMALCPERR